MCRLYSTFKGECTNRQSVVSQCITTEKQYDSKLRTPVIGNSLKQIMVSHSTHFSNTIRHTPLLIHSTHLPFPSFSLFFVSQAKLNYGLWRVDLSTSFPLSRRGPSGAMVIGVDVCHDKVVSQGYIHPSFANLRDRSTVGFIASYDPDLTVFHGFVTFQGRYEEYVTTSAQLMKKSLEGYKKQNKVYPSSILIYRDGVGDSQLSVRTQRDRAVPEGVHRAGHCTQTDCDSSAEETGSSFL